MHKATKGHRYGFTLVELLIAIAIIGLLMAIAVPTAYAAYRKAKKAAMKMEVINLSNAVEQYRQKYGDYPPDGSNVPLLRRHIRKAFPRIIETELNYLARACGALPNPQTQKYDFDFDPGVINRAEALVFFLGGFSSDPQRPFTGRGGPLFVPPTVFTPESWTPEYNTDRENAIFDFGSNLREVDETALGMKIPILGGDEPPDIMPVSQVRGCNVPTAYFDSRTYVFNLGAGNIFNAYENTSSPALSFGTARPYLSTVTSTTGGGYKYQNDKTFQIVCAGLDNQFGGFATNPASATKMSPVGTVLFIFPTGQPVVVSSSETPSDRYNASLNASAQLDNVTNFSEATLEDGLSN